MSKKRNSVIICGRQRKKAYENILNIINFLEADVFLVYENDSFNYSKLAIDSLKVEDDKKLSYMFPNHQQKINSQKSKKVGI